MHLQSSRSPSSMCSLPYDVTLNVERERCRHHAGSGSIPAAVRQPAVQAHEQESRQGGTVEYRRGRKNSAAATD